MLQFFPTTDLTNELPAHLISRYICLLFPCAAESAASVRATG